MTDAESDPHGRRGLPTLPKTIKVRDRVYRVLEDVGGAGRKRYWVRDRRAGPRGDYRQILVLPRGEASSQHIAALQRLSHGNPNLPTILDCETRGDEIFVVTNWVRGPDLETYLEDVRSKAPQRLTPTEVMKLYRGLAHGLSQMHQHRGVRHGDIKPANLIIAREPNRLVMIDFGSAWMTERTTRRDPGDGTSHGYTAPERLDDRQRPDNEGSVVDARSEQFSATVVAYEMLTGVLPYGKMGGKAGLLENRPIYEPLYRDLPAGYPQRADKFPGGSGGSSTK